MCRLLSVILCLFLGGCAGITAVNIPGIGYFDSDPPPVTADDKFLMRQALTAAADQRRTGAFQEWYNPATGHSGSFKVTRVFFRNIPDPYGSPYGANNPAAEVTETIHAGGRDFITEGIGIYFGYSGDWFRYK